MNINIDNLTMLDLTNITGFPKGEFLNSIFISKLNFLLILKFFIDFIF